MKINISNLSERIHTYELSRSATELGLGPNFIGSVKASVTLEKSSRQILLKAQIQSKATFQCDRCTEEYTAELSPVYEALYVWNETERRNGNSEEFHVLASDTNVIDISEDVRQYVLLSVPLKLLCRENCAGLCPHCGQNLNQVSGGKHECTKALADPRWNKLVERLQDSTKKN